MLLTQREIEFSNIYLEQSHYNLFKSKYENRSDIKNFSKILYHNTSLRIGHNGKINKGSKPKQRFTKLCYRYVKTAMKKSGMASKYLGGSKAYQAKSYLRKEGYTNLLDHPETASKIKSFRDFPNGTILVYRGGKAGHIEVKTEYGFISDFVNKRPVTKSLEKNCKKCKYQFKGRNRQLIGAYVKGEVI